MKIRHSIEAAGVVFSSLLGALSLLGCVSDSRELVPVRESHSALAQPVTAAVTISSHWGDGYCADVRVTNSSQTRLSGWSVVLQLGGASVSTLWNAEQRPSTGTLTAKSLGYNGHMEVGQSAQFGFCASGAANAGVPTIVESTGTPIADAAAGLKSSLSLQADWPQGYCAKVVIRNDTSATTQSWSVVVDLGQSVMTNSWSATVSTSAGKTLFQPLSYNAVLAPGASTELGFCANKTGENYRPSIVAPGSKPKSLTVAVYVPKRVATCFVGDPCAPGTSNCVGLRNDDNELVEGFVDASFAAMRTTGPGRGLAPKEVCLEMVLSEQDRAEISGQLTAFRDNVRDWTHEDVALDLRTIEFERLDMDLSRWGGGVWIAPWNIAEFALPRLDFVPDFNLVIPPIRDPERKLHHDLGGCGGTYGADFGLAGAGWSWVPKTKSSFWFDCAEQPVFTHEWLHQVHFAYHELSRFEDIYGWSLPACGLGDPERHKWFPDSHQCNEDPDYARCGLADCGSNDLVNAHILSTHWDPSVAFVANHCRDGVQDFGETGVDTGGRCQEGTDGQAVLGAAITPVHAPVHPTVLPTR